MRRITVGTAPGFLDEPPNTGAGRVNQTVAATLYRTFVRRPRRWRKPQVWLADAGAREFRAAEPVVAVCHGAPWLIDPSILDMAPVEFWKPVVRQMEANVRAASMTIVPTEYTRQAIITGWRIDPEQVVVVHHGVDPRRFAHRPGGRQIVAELLGEDRPYVLFVGVASPQKRILQLKKAMATLAHEGYEHALVIAGPRGLEPPEWRDEVARELDGAPGRLCWIEPGGDDQLIRLFSDADVLCLPSVGESFGLPVLEAMACSTPVVVGNRAALPEVVADAGVLCEPTVGGVLAGLKQVLDEPAVAQALAEKGRARAEALTWSVAAAGYASVLARAVRGPGTRPPRGT